MENEELLEALATRRLNRNQEKRGEMIAALTEDVKATATDPKLAYVLLAALKDSDSSDIKRLQLQQKEKEISQEGRALDFLQSLTKVAKRNPYYQPDGTVADSEIPRPASYAEDEQYIEGELDQQSAPMNYASFMTDRNALPNEDSDSANDSQSWAARR